MKEILLIVSIWSSEAASETDTDIEQGSQSAVGHKDDSEDGISDALGYGVGGLAIRIGNAPVEDCAEDQSSDYSGRVAARHKNII